MKIIVLTIMLGIVIAQGCTTTTIIGPKGDIRVCTVCPGGIVHCA